MYRFSIYLCIVLAMRLCIVLALRLCIVLALLLTFKKNSGRNLRIRVMLMEDALGSNVWFQQVTNIPVMILVLKLKI